MTADNPIAPPEAVTYAPPDKPRPPRVWPAVVLIGLYWACLGVSSLLEVSGFSKFLFLSAVLALAVLGYLVWWLSNGRVRWRDRLLVLACAIAAPVVAVFVADKSLGPVTVFSGVPVMLTAWAVWLLLTRKASRPVWRNGLVVVLFAAACWPALFRMQGLQGSGSADLRWRWTKSSEALYLAQRSGSAPTTRQAHSRPSAAALALRPGDWPAFRGANRDSVVRGVTIATDWNTSPPKLLWRQRVGPAWSSVIVVDGRVVTQEQRGPNEAVVCRDAETGSELWVYEAPGRFEEAMGSLGPRATPTFADGRIYAQGAAGQLVCLDGFGGRKVWSRDVLTDAGGKMPDFGVSSSPLVTHGNVLVFSHGQGGKGLLAYRADTGELAWAANAGNISYSSPQLATLGGKEQVLMISDAGCFGIDPQSGAVLWKYDAPGQPPRSLQPLRVSDDELLVPLGLEVSTDLVKVSLTGDSFTAARRWTSRNLKPPFNDFVVHDGFIYGFDGSMFSCVDLKTGDRRWKKGRYGAGQVLLLADQPVLLVTTERGEAVLVAANPDSFQELGQFQAIEGKTWNHPVVAHGRLYVRNAAEMACYALKPKP